VVLIDKQPHSIEGSYKLFPVDVIALARPDSNRKPRDYAREAGLCPEAAAVWVVHYTLQTEVEAGSRKNWGRMAGKDEPLTGGLSLSGDTGTVSQRCEDPEEVLVPALSWGPVI